MKRQPVAGVDFDPDAPMCEDDYQWFMSGGQYAGNGWAEWKERDERKQRECNHIFRRVLGGDPDEMVCDRCHMYTWRCWVDDWKKGLVE